MKIGKVIMTACACSILLMGCSSAQSADDTMRPTDSKGSSSQVSVHESEHSDTSATSEAICENRFFIQDFSEMITAHPTAHDMIAFMQSSLPSAAPDEADIVLSRLLLSQAEIAKDWTNMLFDGRIEGFWQMNNTWSDAAIQNIENQDIRSAYQNLSDCYLHMVTYEETPIVETHWDRLKDFEKYFSQDAQALIEVSAKLQSPSNYYRDNDYTALIQDILLLETPIKHRQSDYLSYRMNKTYNRLIAKLFYGPEGATMDYWNDPESPFYQAIKGVFDQHPDTEFAQLCKAFYTQSRRPVSPDNKNNILRNMITSYNAFGLQSPFTLSTSIRLEDNYTQNMTLVSSALDPEIGERINTAILREMDQLESEIKADSSASSSLWESTYQSLSNSKYLSISLYASLSDSTGKHLFKEKPLVFDMDTGAPLCLEEFLGKSYEEYAPILLSILKSRYANQNTFVDSLEALPKNQDFLIDEYGLMLQFNASEMPEAYRYPFTAHLAHEDLDALYDVITIYE